MKEHINATPVSVVLRVPKPILMKDKATLRFDLLVLDELTGATILSSRGWRFSKGTLTPPATKVKSFFYPLAAIDGEYQKMIECGIKDAWQSDFPDVAWDRPQVPTFDGPEVNATPAPARASE